MCNQNIISNKFDFILTTRLSSYFVNSYSLYVDAKNRSFFEQKQRCHTSVQWLVSPRFKQVYHFCLPSCWSAGGGFCFSLKKECCRMECWQIFLMMMWFYCFSLSRKILYKLVEVVIVEVCWSALGSSFVCCVGSKHLLLNEGLVTRWDYPLHAIPEHW